MVEMWLWLCLWGTHPHGAVAPMGIVQPRNTSMVGVSMLAALESWMNRRIWEGGIDSVSYLCLAFNIRKITGG